MANLGKKNLENKIMNKNNQWRLTLFINGNFLPTVILESQKEELTCFLDHILNGRYTSTTANIGNIGAFRSEKLDGYYFAPFQQSPIEKTTKLMEELVNKIPDENNGEGWKG